MGQMTKLDPSVTNQLLNQPNANPGTPGCSAWQQTAGLASLGLECFATYAQGKLEMHNGGPACSAYGLLECRLAFITPFE